VAASLPNDRLEIRIEVTGPTSRRFEILAHAPTLHPVVERLAALLMEKEKPEKWVPPLDWPGGRIV
jgi:hypothetical protein